MELSDVRRHHLSVVLEHLVRHGPRSRAGIAHDTGLTKATVSSLVAELVELGLVDTLDTPRGGAVGRPATSIAAAGRGVGGLGLQIEVDEVAACVVYLAGDRRVVSRLRPTVRPHVLRLDRCRPKCYLWSRVRAVAV
jgi:hypothetical protein